MAPPPRFEGAACCLLCGPARGDLDEPGRAIAVKSNFLRPAFRSSSMESESELPEARGDAKESDEPGEGDTGRRQEETRRGRETACGVNKRAAACQF